MCMTNNVKLIHSFNYWTLIWTIIMGFAKSESGLDPPPLRAQPSPAQYLQTPLVGANARVRST